jgi:hypothetical protein
MPGENKSASGLLVGDLLAGIGLQLDQLFDSPVGHVAENRATGCPAAHSVAPLAAAVCLYRSSLKAGGWPVPGIISPGASPGLLSRSGGWALLSAGAGWTAVEAALRACSR